MLASRRGIRTSRGESGGSGTFYFTLVNSVETWLLSCTIVFYSHNAPVTQRKRLFISSEPLTLGLHSQAALNSLPVHHWCVYYLGMLHSAHSAGWDGAPNVF